MILLWGRPSEAPLAAVQHALIEQGADVLLIDERRSLTTSAQLRRGSPHAGELQVDGRRIDLARVSGVYFRPYGTQAVLDRVELTRRPEVARRLEAVSSLLWAWADVTPAMVLNRPTLMASNASKPLQARLLAACGFEIPQTLVTTDIEAARQFIDAHNAVIYKSISATRSIVKRLDASQISSLERLRCCPVQLQSHVPGVDVRVHVVGSQLFACALRSEADDYRYSARAGLKTVVSAIDLPPDIAARCLQTSIALGLSLCGIDLRHTPDGRWVAFEVNPSPGFSYFAESTGAPIAQAVARLLIDGSAEG